MFSLFRKRPTIQDLEVPTWDWQLVHDQPDLRQWVSPEQDMALLLHFFDKKPDLPQDKDLAVIRSFYREQVVAVNGGLLEAERYARQGLDMIRTLIKLPQEPHGMAYVGALTFPFKYCSFVAKLQAIESGTTGMREAVITGQLLAAGEWSTDMEGWAQDPYDPAYKEGTPMNQAEAEAYDAQFPTHPLSRVRAHLRLLEEGLSLNEKLHKESTFWR